MSVICPCKTECNLVDSSVKYGKSYGPMWLCPNCGASVGCHKGTENPLGVPADYATRKARMAAHTWFDYLWRNHYMGRNHAYKWMQEVMRLSKDEAHIGSFTIKQCKMLVVEIHKLRARWER